MESSITSELIAEVSGYGSSSPQSIPVTTDQSTESMETLSLIDVLKTCDGYNDGQIDQIDSKQLMNLPFIDSIMNNQFDINTKSLDELLQAVTTYSYLNIDSNELIKQILWLLGSNKKRFYDFFTSTDENMYTFKDNIDVLIRNEFRRYLKKPPFISEQLSIRFADIYTLNCLNVANFELLKWAGQNGRLLCKMNKVTDDIDVFGVIYNKILNTAYQKA